LIFYPELFCETKYVREVVFETEPNEEPYNLDISFNPPTPFATKIGEGSRDITIPNSIYFDNKVRLIKANYADNEIIVYDIEKNDYIKFKPILNEFNKMHIIGVGPKDDIFIELTKSGNTPYERYYKLVKYTRLDNEYVEDSSFSTNIFAYRFRNLYISPDNYLFSSNCNSGEGISWRTNILNPEGQLEKQSNAICRTKNGIEFYFKTETLETKVEKVKIIDESSNVSISEYEVKNAFVYDLIKATFNNEVIFQAFNVERIDLNDDLYLLGEKPIFIVFDLDLNTQSKISISDCAREDFKYFSVSKIDCNYLGDLFAIVIYFNSPGKITGDEKIAFYKWHREEE